MNHIYKITNIINGKIYIGLTTNDIETRFKQHKNAAITKRDSASHLYNAMRKYGRENFKVELIKSYSPNIDIFKKETYWIRKLDSINPKIGYNLKEEDGSGGKPTFALKLHNIKISRKTRLKNYKKENRPSTS